MCWKGSLSKVKVEAAASRETTQAPAMYMQETDTTKYKLLGQRDNIERHMLVFPITLTFVVWIHNFPLNFHCRNREEKAASLSLQNPTWLTVWLGNSPRFSVFCFCVSRNSAAAEHRACLVPLWPRQRMFQLLIWWNPVSVSASVPPALYQF